MRCPLPRIANPCYVRRMGNPFNPGYYEADELRSFGFAHVGQGARIAKNCLIIEPENISLGENSRVDAFVTLIASQGWIDIGSYVHIGGFSHIAARGGFTMEDYSGLSQRVSIYTASDDYSGRFMTNPTVPAELTGCTVLPVTLGRHAIIGSGAVILPGCDIGEGAALGALSLACRPVPAWEIHAGSPATRRGVRRRDLLDGEARHRGRREAVA